MILYSNHHFHIIIDAGDCIYNYICKTMILHTISQYIESEQLFNTKDKLLIALSGGADSVALLQVLISLGYQCEAAHCNFHLRGDESNRDEVFVQTLCKQLNIPLHIIHFDTKQYATENKVSIEMAARELRYTWFEALRKEIGASGIAVAHHKDDSVETIILNLIRGTGISGLTGIQPKVGHIVRPLLCVSRQQIIDYLASIGQKYVTDSTNLQDEYTRNKIRLKLLPMMEEFNPSIKNSIITTGKYLNGAYKIYQEYIEEGKKRVLSNNGINIEALSNETSPENLLYEILYPLGFNSSQVEEVYKSISKQSGKVFYSKQGWRITKDRAFLLIDNGEAIDVPPFQLSTIEFDYNDTYNIKRDKNIACCDADKLKGELQIRKWQTGDKFFPLGMKGRKLVSDYMTDCKFSRTRKENQWILLSGEDIVWIVGERLDDRFKIDNNTRKIVEFTIENKR